MLQPALLARRLSDGLYGKLEYDFACQRGHGFGEAYVHGALIDLLASNLDSSAYSIESGYAVPELQPEKPDDAKGGRKREVDFAVIPRGDSTDKSKVHLCLEVKWAGSSHATPILVLRDLVRLQLVVDANPGAVALFVLAGPKRDVPNCSETTSSTRATLAAGVTASFPIRPRAGLRTTTDCQSLGLACHAI